MNLSKNLYYYHTGDVVTVFELLKDKRQIFFNKKNPITTLEFLSFKSDEGLSNEESIKSSYVTNDEKLLMGEKGGLKIKPNTQLVIPKLRASKTEVHPQNSIPENNYKDILFKNSVLTNLQKNPGYKVIHPQIKGTSGNELVNKIPKVSVWLWSRVLGNINSEEGWFDLSPFISSCTTNVSSNGGNFTLLLPPISCEFKNGKWSLKKEEIQYYSQSNDEVHYVSKTSFFSEEYRESQIPELVVQGVKHKKRNKILFHSIISPNDLVFIKFDTLELERDYRWVNSNFRPLSSSQLPNKVYDMIGLVDTSTIKTDILPTNINLSLQIQGRDLIKPLIEDGTYFFPTEYANKGYKDLYFSSGSIVQLSIPLFRNIKEIISFFIEKLSNIRVIPNNVLNYGNGQGNGIWKLINLLVDKSVLKRTVVDSSISIAQGSLLSHFHKICQEPLVEFYSDTYYDQFYLTIRTPPFSKKHLSQVLSGVYTDENGTSTFLETSYITIDEGSILSEELSFEDSEVYTWFYLTPKEVVGGLSQDVWTSIFPPKIFPELVEIYGSKPLQFTHNYLSYTLDLENEKPKITKTVKEQALEDLKFLIEGHVHLPFTRSGKITIVGDRRLKRGEYVFYAPTNELFYIEHVTHSYSSSTTIQSTTTIQVSRGMVVDYINGKNGISYFNIVSLDTEDIYSEVDEKEYVSKEVEVKKTKRVLKRISSENIVDPSITNFPRKSNVNISKTNWRLLNYLNQLPKEYKSLVYITSGSDGSHMEDSQHYTGDAIDLRLPDKEKLTPDQSHKDRLYRFIKNDPQREVFGIEPPPHPNHGNAPHIHLEVYKKFLNSNQSKDSETVYSYVDEEYIDFEEQIEERLTGKKVKVLNITKTLDSIKVNKEVLNFFLKREQFK